MKRIMYLMVALGVAACSQPTSEWIKPSSVTLGCEDYQSVELDHAVLYNNVWNKGAARNYDWEQCLEQKPSAEVPIYGWSWNWPKKGRNIFGYPQIKVGSSPWEPLPGIDARFPIKMDSLRNLFVSHNVEISSDGEHNVATTLWLTRSPEIGDTPNKSVITAEIMIWTYATVGHMNPAGRKIGLIQQNERTWSVWLSQDWGDASGHNENKWINVTFKSEQPHLSNRYDVIALLNNDLLSDLRLEQNYIADIELGTEIMRGQGLVWVNSFEVETIFQ